MASDIHLKVISQEMPQASIAIINLKMPVQNVFQIFQGSMS